MTRDNPRVFEVSFLTEKLHKGQKRELCFESEEGRPVSMRQLYYCGSHEVFFYKWDLAQQSENSVLALFLFYMFKRRKNICLL